MSITPEQARAELARRQSGGTSTTPSITPEQAKAELQKRQATKEPGFIQGIAQSLAKPFLRVASTPKVANALPVLGLGAGAVRNSAKKTTDYKGDDTYDYGYLGKVEPLGQKKTTWGNVKDIAGTGLEIGSTVLPVGKIPTLAKATLAGRIGQGAKAGFKGGATGGAMYGAGSELQQDDATLGSVAANTAVNAGFGAAGGTVLGGALPLPVATGKFARSSTQPTSYTKRVVQISKPNAQKFQRMAGEPAEKYLVDRGIYGTNEEIISELQKRFQYSRDLADTELAKLGGTWTHPSLKAALKELADREARTTLPGVQSLDSRRVAELVAKEQASGLSMSEVNEVKRLFEKNVKTGYLRENLADKVQLAKNIDSNLREWQLETARKLGLENLDQINKETQLAYQLGDSIHRKITGGSDNGGLDLLDAVLLAGGDPYSIGLFATRKGLKSERLQSNIARRLGGEAKVGLPQAKTRAPITDNGRLLPVGNPNTTNAIPLGFPSGQVTEADRIANNALQNSRIQKPEPLSLPPANPDTPYNLGGAPIPLRPRNTIEPPAKTIRQYDRLQPRLLEQNPIPLPGQTQANQYNKNIVATPAANASAPNNIGSSIPQKLENLNSETGIYSKGSKFYVNTQKVSEKQYVDKLLTGVGRQRSLNKQMLQSFYRDQQRKQNPQSGKMGIAPMVGGGVAASAGVGALSSIPSITTTTSMSTPAMASTTAEEMPNTSATQTKTKLDRKDLERRFVHVENRGARDLKKNLYEVVGKTGDLGKYQVSPDSLYDWSEPWLGKQYTKEEFLADKQAQEDFFNEFLNVAERYNLSPDEIAVAWHSGWGELGRGERETREKRFKESLKKRIKSGDYKEYVETFNEI